MKAKKLLFFTICSFILLSFVIVSTSFTNVTKGTLKSSFENPEYPSHPKKPDQLNTIQDLPVKDIILNKNESTSSIDDISQNEVDDTFVLSFEENPFSQLFRENPDFVGWINIADTNINLPILKGVDNEYYLKHDFYRKENYYGSIFMDYRNFGSGYDKNTIIYGHNMKDRQMFGDLSLFMDPDFANSHSTISIDTLYGTERYRIFSVYFEEANIDLIQTSFQENEFELFLSKIKTASVHNFDINVSDSDKILTLITCSYEIDNGRYFVHAVKL